MNMKLELKQPNKPTSVYLSDSQSQKINLLALANTRSKSGQIRWLIDSIPCEETEKALHVVTEDIYANWKIDQSSAKNWNTFIASARNWLHAKYIDKVNTELIINKLNENYEKNNKLAHC